MNKNLLKIAVENEKSLVPLIFTKKQIDVLKKRLQEKKLTNGEKKALYTSIKKKMGALEIIKNSETETNLYITGRENILEGRVKEAEKIIGEYRKKYNQVFIAGSFLFSKNYNDIDIFIVVEKGYKEAWEEKNHLVFISEKGLAKPTFQSTAKISISTFPITNKLEKKKPKLSEVMATYHEAVIECMNKAKKPELIRQLIFDYHLFCKNEVLNPKKLQELAKSASLENLDYYVKGLCTSLFSKSYIYVGIQWYIKTLDEDIKSTKRNRNLIQYKKTYEELIYGRQRNKEANA